MLVDRISKIIGDSWVFVKSKSAFKKKDGDYLTHLYIWRSHNNRSYEYIIYDGNLTVNRNKKLIMSYQFRGTYHMESESVFNESWKSFENKLITDVLPVINDLNSNNETVLKKMTSIDNFWKYHVDIDYLVERLGKDALKDLSKEVFESRDFVTKSKIIAYLDGDKEALNPDGTYWKFCENGLFDDVISK
ncbi:MAG: hypothetical protein J6U54_00745 [Clostridiales bacterium]|nr:hypothetical protein [Clostridiales bacterium]